MRRRWGLRRRLTLHYAGVLALGFVLYAAATYFVLQRHAYEDLDHRLQEDVELAARHAVVGADDRVRWRHEEAVGITAEEEEGGHWVEVWDGPLRVLASGTAAARDLGPGPRQAVTAAHSTGGRDPVRVLTRAARIGRHPVLIRAAIAEAPLRARLHRLLIGLFAALPLVLLAATAGGWVIAGRALAPVAEMAARARRITAEHLSERLPVDRDDELGQLARTFNDTFLRLERSFEQLRRFTADASHELRTPLTALRSVGEVALARAHGPAEYREVVASMLEETARLTRMVDALLTLARSDAGQLVLARESFDAGDLTREVVSSLAVLAEERGQVLEAASAGPVPVRADRGLLRQAVSNLVDNAVKHSPPGASIAVRAAATAAAALIEVEDDGPGIPGEDRPRVFDRFYRLDRGRARDAGGVGLGLALTRAAVEANGGSIELLAGAGGGCLFRILLPRA